MKTPKKIALVYSGAKYFGGIETYLSSLFEYVKGDDLEIVLYSLGEWEITSIARRRGLKVVVLPRSALRIWTVFGLVKEIKRQKTNLIVSQGMVANFYARMSAIFSGVPSLVVVHSLAGYDYPGILKRALFLLSEKLLGWVTVKHIAVSEFIKKDLISSGMNEKNIRVVLNGLVLKPEVFQNPYGLRLGSIGRLHKVKGYDQLIRAVALLPNTQLTIWGEGSEEEPLKKLITELKITDRVRLAGRAHNLKETFRQIDYYIQPSRSEGFGLTVVEAMIAGKPVVVTPAGSLSEIVKDGETGIVAKGFDAKHISQAISEMVNNREKSFSMAKKAQAEAIQKYDVKRWAHETIKVFLEVAK